MIFAGSREFHQPDQRFYITRARTKRMYGPYLNGRPNLPIGVYTAQVSGIDSFSSEPTSYSVIIGRFEYTLEPKDVVELCCFCDSPSEDVICHNGKYKSACRKHVDKFRK